MLEDLLEKKFPTWDQNAMPDAGQLVVLLTFYNLNQVAPELIINTLREWTDFPLDASLDALARPRIQRWGNTGYHSVIFRSQTLPPTKDDEAPVLVKLDDLLD